MARAKQTARKNCAHESSSSVDEASKRHKISHEPNSFSENSNDSDESLVFTLHNQVFPPTNWDDSIHYLTKSENVPSTNVESELIKWIDKESKYKNAFEIKNIDNTTFHPAAGQKGLFATTKISPNQCIGYYTGVVLPIEETSLDYSYVLENGTHAIDAKVKGNEFRYINDYHRTKLEPNIRTQQMGTFGPIIFITTQNINAGEELIIDYGENYWNGLGKYLDGLHKDKSRYINHELAVDWFLRIGFEILQATGEVTIPAKHRLPPIANEFVNKAQNCVRKDPAIWGYVADLESLELKLKNTRNLNTFVPDFGWNANTLKEAIKILNESKTKEINGPVNQDSWCALTNINSNEIIKFPSKIKSDTFSKVYKGDWLGKEVILKCSKSDHINDFLVECKLLLHTPCHPNILTSFGVCKIEKKNFLVTEYMNLGNLETIFGSTNWRHYNERIFVVSNISLSIARGIMFLHIRKIVHRNLKPTNILLSGNSIFDPHLQVKIADFGATKETSKEGYVCNELNDIFSYGSLLCFMFTKKVITSKLDFQKVRNTLNETKGMQQWSQLIERCIEEEGQRPNINDIIKFLTDWNNNNI